LTKRQFHSTPLAQFTDATQIGVGTTRHAMKSTIQTKRGLNSQTHTMAIQTMQQVASFLDWIRIDLDDVFVKPHSLLIIHLVFPFCISLLAILSTLSHKHTPRQNKNTIFSSSSACGLALAFLFSPFFFFLWY